MTYRWERVPGSILGLVTVDRGGAVAILSECVRGTDRENMVLARAIATVFTTRAKRQPPPHVDVFRHRAWSDQRSRRPMWAQAALWCVSEADCRAMVSGRATPEEIGARRGVPAWSARDRIQQEIAYGAGIEGDRHAAMAALALAGPRFLAWMARPGWREQFALTG